MPRSLDGRWTAECRVCGKSFQQRKTTQVVCSVKCRGKLPHRTGGVRPKTGLAPRECPVCGKSFTPVRENQICCSHGCYRKSPSWRESQRRNDARPERQQRQNELRRLTDGDEQRNELIREYNLRYNLRKYGITTETYVAMLEAQEGRCRICGRMPDPDGMRAASRLHVDHDHATGRLRDLLCNVCNRGIGFFADDPALLRVAAEYIERHRTEG